MIIGITGSIATGKTLVTNYLREKGYKVIDADEISRAVLNKGEKGYDEVLKYFSENILDQEKNIDRKKLAQIIFTDEKKRRVLEKIIHPLVINEILNFIDNSDKKEDVFVSMPLLYEINFQNHLDKVIAVYSNRDKQIERLTKRDNISYEYAIKKIESQYPQEKKVELADYFIDNSLSKEETIKNIEKIIERMRKDNGN